MVTIHLGQFEVPCNPDIAIEFAMLVMFMWFVVCPD